MTAVDLTGDQKLTKEVVVEAPEGAQQPKEGEMVWAHYTGMLLDGKEGEMVWAHYTGMLLDGKEGEMVWAHYTGMLLDGGVMIIFTILIFEFSN
jgi:FKBP-type peptidyl-prolyl cis-trans isomerase